MLITPSISGYKHVSIGNIKLAFAMVCRDELFRGVYFHANALYYVNSGTAVIHSDSEHTTVHKGEIALIKQHSRLDIQKLKDNAGSDFSSVIFFLFPDFVTHFLHRKRLRNIYPISDAAVVSIGHHPSFQHFSESLSDLFGTARPDVPVLRSKTCEALALLSQHSPNFLAFLSANASPIKIDLYEFMLHNSLSNCSVGEFARLTGRSLSAFKRDFREVFHTTPHQWVLHQKIDCAEKLLRESGMRASDIYYLLGFRELSHFCAAFKKIKGVSPTQISAHTAYHLQ